MRYLLDTHAFLWSFFQKHVYDAGFSVLPIERDHLVAVHQLEFFHRDPFDRLIAAQSQVEGIALICGDTAFDAYGITRVW